jgi:hypothetical protein
MMPLARNMQGRKKGAVSGCASIKRQSGMHANLLGHVGINVGGAMLFHNVV